jgi:hypothetical protein
MKMFMTLLLLLCGWLPQAAAEPIGLPKDTETPPVYDTGKETGRWLNQWCVYIHDNAPEWYEQARVWVIWHPNETIAYVLGTLLVLTWLFRRRRQVRLLKAEIRWYERELEAADNKLSAEGPGNTFILSREANEGGEHNGIPRQDDTTLHDVLAKFATVQDESLRQVVGMHTTTVEHLRATQESALDLLKVQQNNVNATIQGACKQAIDAAHIAARASADASTRSATEAQTKVLEVVKLAIEALKVANIEHAKAETATVAALSTTAQRSIDGTRNLVDALTENKD